MEQTSNTGRLGQAYISGNTNHDKHVAFHSVMSCKYFCSTSVKTNAVSNLAAYGKFYIISESRCKESTVPLPALCTSLLTFSII